MEELLRYAGTAVAVVAIAYVLLRSARRGADVPVCCPAGALPFLAACEHVPTGTDGVDLGRGFRGYVTGVGDASSSWTGRPVLILMSDIFGYQSGRHFQIADFWAESTAGIAVLPDLFDGQPMVKVGGTGHGIAIVWPFLLALIQGKSKPWALRTGDAIQSNLEAIAAFLRAKGVAQFAMAGVSSDFTHP